MLLDIDAFPAGSTVTADIAVVGSGIAGAEVAMFLSRHGVRVALLESGRRAFDPAIQALNELRFVGKRHRTIDPDASYHRYLPPELRGVSRVRQLGGTSNVWTGKWKHLQPTDFPGRSWVPNSAWPIAFEDVLPYYRATAGDYGFGDLEAEARRSGIVELRSRVEATGLKMSSFYWEAEPTRTAIRFAEEMEGSATLRVVTGATATHLGLAGDGRTVETVTCRSLEGHELSVSAGAVVLAAGALETPRLLLASRDRLPAGIGNEHGLVGRFYTDHPKHHSGVLEPGPLSRAFAGELQYAPKPRFGLCFALDDATQREHELLEHVLYLRPMYAPRWKRFVPSGLGGACRDGNGRVESYRVKFVTEQVPNPESRLLLSEDPDPLGVPRAVLDWRFTEHDRRSLAQAAALLEQRCADAGLGRVDFGRERPSLETMTDAAHQMGTTRMAESPGEGVVDPHCRVFGTENLYVAGSAVFPTGPSYSPTFTILALARRLAEHLLGARVGTLSPPLRVRSSRDEGAQELREPPRPFRPAVPPDLGEGVPPQVTGQLRIAE